MSHKTTQENMRKIGYILETEACQKYNIPSGTIYGASTYGHLDRTKVNGRAYVKESTLKEWNESRNKGNETKVVEQTPVTVHMSPPYEEMSDAEKNQYRSAIIRNKEQKFSRENGKLHPNGWNSIEAEILPRYGTIRLKSLNGDQLKDYLAFINK